MRKLKRMDQVTTILETYLETGSIKATARRLQVSKNTIKNYVGRALKTGKQLPELLQLPDEELLPIFYTSKNKSINTQEALFLSKLEYWTKELRRVGVTRQLLWEEYRMEEPNGLGYSQFCDRLKKTIGHKELTLSLTHPPGKVMQVDFAGKKMRWVDISTGEVHDCQVLIAVMPHSQQTFAIALPSQKVADFIHGLNEALLFFGKLPKVILSDNLKSFVVRADRYDPKFNDLCIQLAAHYQLDLQATRVAKPKDKASVENMVKTAYTRIYAPLRDEIFHSLEDINQAIRHQLVMHNTKKYQKKPGCRQAIFEQYELPEMRDLPSDLFEIIRTTNSKIQRNYHAFIGEDKNFYSVPFQHVGKQTVVVYTSKIVEIYLNNQRIAIHDRMPGKGSYIHITNPEHMPKNHQDWREAQGYNAAYFSKQANKIGPATGWAIGQVLISKFHETQSFNSCKLILLLGKKYTNQRLELAALRCQNLAGKVNYRMLKNILTKKLDQQSEDPNLFSPPKHDNIRGDYE